MRENTIDLSHADKSRVRVVRIEIFARSNFKNDLYTDAEAKCSTYICDRYERIAVYRSIARSSRG